MLKLNKELLPAPVLAPGGGPAGVVEFPKSEEGCLLVGVVLASLEGALLSNRPPPPPAAPKGFEAACEEFPVSEGLFGVENKEVEGATVVIWPGWDFGCEEPNNPTEGVLVVFEGPKLKPPPAAEVFTFADELPPLAVLPNGELVAVPPPAAPKREPDGAALPGALPKSPPPVLLGPGVVDPKSPPDDGALEVVEPRRPVPPLEEVAWPNEKVGWGFAGSAIIFDLVCFYSLRGKREGTERSSQARSWEERMSRDHMRNWTRTALVIVE